MCTIWASSQESVILFHLNIKVSGLSAHPRSLISDVFLVVCGKYYSHNYHNQKVMILTGVDV